MDAPRLKILGRRGNSSCAEYSLQHIIRNGLVMIIAALDNKLIEVSIGPPSPFMFE